MTSSGTTLGCNVSIIDLPCFTNVLVFVKKFSRELKLKLIINTLNESTTIIS